MPEPSEAPSSAKASEETTTARSATRLRFFMAPTHSAQRKPFTRKTRASPVMRTAVRFWLLFLCLISLGCGPAPIDPLVIEAGVRREVFLVEGSRPPPSSTLRSGTRLRVAWWCPFAEPLSPSPPRGRGSQSLGLDDDRSVTEPHAHRVLLAEGREQMHLVERISSADEPRHQLEVSS